jgi:hypothetical protein
MPAFAGMTDNKLIADIYVELSLAFINGTTLPVADPIW